jgi:hypothetical protein
MSAARRIAFSSMLAAWCRLRLASLAISAGNAQKFNPALAKSPRKPTRRSYSREHPVRRAIGRCLLNCHISLQGTVCAPPADHGPINPDGRLPAQLARLLLRCQRLIRRVRLTRASREQGRRYCWCSRPAWTSSQPLRTMGPCEWCLTSSGWTTASVISRCASLARAARSAA